MVYAYLYARSPCRNCIFVCVCVCSHTLHTCSAGKRTPSSSRCHVMQIGKALSWVCIFVCFYTLQSVHICMYICIFSHPTHLRCRHENTQQPPMQNLANRCSSHFPRTPHPKPCVCARVRVRVRVRVWASVRVSERENV